MKTKNQLQERIDVLEKIFSTHLLRNLREQFVKECAKVDGLKKELAKESKLKQEWQDNADRLMTENEQLRRGVSPDALEKYWKKKSESLQKKLDRLENPWDVERKPVEQVEHQPEPEQKKWWQKLFNLNA